MKESGMLVKPHVRRMWWQWLREEGLRYLVFLFGGGLSLLMNLVLTTFFTTTLHLWHMLSFALALSIEMAFLLVYHTRVTFRKEGRIERFVAVIGLISFCNWCGVFVVDHWLMPAFSFTMWELTVRDYHVSIVLVAGVISVLNYMLNRFWVFEPEAKQPAV